MNFDVLSLDGVCMRPVAATGPGEVDRETLFWFSQQGPVVSAALCELLRLPDGRIRLTEHFSWDSREGSGSNVLEQIPSDS
jgi:hypothetical protein